MKSISHHDELFVKMVLLAWTGQNNQLEKLLDALTPEQLSKEISPGKNTGTYLLGHLIAVSDLMLPLLGFGQQLYPYLEDIFIKHPDKSGLKMPSISELKEILQTVNGKLNEHFHVTTAAGWFERHTSVSPEDFIKEPHRNRLNAVITRTHHMAYHLGQMGLLR